MGINERPRQVAHIERSSGARLLDPTSRTAQDLRESSGSPRTLQGTSSSNSSCTSIPQNHGHPLDFRNTYLLQLLFRELDVEFDANLGLLNKTIVGSWVSIFFIILHLLVPMRDCLVRIFFANGIWRGGIHIRVDSLIDFANQFLIGLESL